VFVHAVATLRAVACGVAGVERSAAVQRNAVYRRPAEQRLRPQLGLKRDSQLARIASEGPILSGRLLEMTPADAGAAGGGSGFWDEKAGEDCGEQRRLRRRTFQGEWRIASNLG